MPHNLQSGFLRSLLIIAVGIFLAATYFNIDLKNTVEGFAASETTKKNWEYVSGIGKTVWKSYLEEPTQHLWNSVLSGLIKDSINQNINNLKALKDGDYEAIKLTPVVPQGIIPSFDLSGAALQENYAPTY